MWPSKVTWGSKSLSSCQPAFSSSCEDMLSLLWGALTRRSRGEPRLMLLLSSRVYWVAEMPAQVEVIIERVIDASWEQVGSGESRFCLRNLTFSKWIMDIIWKSGYCSNKVNTWVGAVNYIHFKGWFHKQYSNQISWIWSNCDSVLVGTWKWLSNEGRLLDDVTVETCFISV